MKFIEPLDDVLGQKLKVRILRCLSLKGAELTGRQIAEEARISPPACHAALKDLVESHVVLGRKVGRAHLFKLNLENCLAQEMLMPLFAKEKSLLQLALRALLKQISVPFISIFLFGSMVQKREAPRSDIDLLIIVAPKHKIKAGKAFDKIGDIFLVKYGKTIAPYILTAVEFQNKYRKRMPLIVEIVKTGIVLQGKTISELLRYGR